MAAKSTGIDMEQNYVTVTLRIGELTVGGRQARVTPTSGDAGF